MSQVDSSTSQTAIHFKKPSNGKNSTKRCHNEQSLSELSKDNLARLVLDYQSKFDLMLKTVKDNMC